MIVTTRSMHKATGLGRPWMLMRFRNVQEDYIVDCQAQFDVDKLIAEIERQLRATNSSRNQAQNVKSKAMLSVVLNHLVKLKNK